MRIPPNSLPTGKNLCPVCRQSFQVGDEIDTTSFEEISTDIESGQVILVLAGTNNVVVHNVCVRDKR